MASIPMRACQAGELCCATSRQLSHMQELAREKGARRAQGQVALPTGGAAVCDAAAAGGGRALGRAAGALRLGARRAQRSRV